MKMNKYPEEIIKNKETMTKGRNSKLETLNPKQTQMVKIQNPNKGPGGD